MPSFTAMPRPYREYRSEIFTDAARSSPAAKPIPEYWSNPYAECVNLGTELLLNHVRMNTRLRNHIFNRKRFVENKQDGIYFNLIEFNEVYRAKFINPDFAGFCGKFMDSLRPPLEDFVKKIGYGAHSFKLVFRLEGRVLEKHMTIFPENTPK